MVEVFKGKSVPSLYTTILKKILDDGVEVGPRGIKTKELSPVIIEVTNPRERLFGHPHRKEVPIFTYIEGMWILLGEDTPDRVGHYVKGMLPFLNPSTGKYDGAYGPRLRGQLRMASTEKIDQLTRVYEQLKKDPDSRRGIVSIHLWELDWNTDSLDIPCTLTYQFLLRNNKLDMIATMRSQDAWLGLIYDTGEFSWFQEILAGWLGVDVGRYIHIDGSLHLYEKDWDRAREVVDKDEGFDIYKDAKIRDARIPKEEFDITLHNLDIIEQDARRIEAETISQITKAVCFKNPFYRDLQWMIRAYNLRLQGKKELSYWMASKCATDLGRIYEMRWRPKNDK